MSEFEFFMEMEDRWWDNMKTLWGSLSICPVVTCIRLPHHMAEELDSISYLKVWGNAQKPHQHMAYLLVWVDNTHIARTYGLSLVWVSLLQTRVSLMVEALEILTTFAFKGLDWPYTLIQLYEGANTCLSQRTNISVFYPRRRRTVQVGGWANLKFTSFYLPDHWSYSPWS